MTSTDPLIGQKLGDYLIQELLGQGGMARVYKGYDDKLARYAAVKVIEPHLIGTDPEEKEEYTERFLREARAIARLNHPNVVNIFQFGQNEGRTLYYMAMGLLEGRDLRHILKTYNKQAKYFAYDQILRICQDIASALDYAHSQGVIHRDVKPSNIMVTNDGRSILTDFGLVLDSSEGTIGNTFGSVHYIAPEQAVSSAQASAQSDIYSLGVVTFEMLTGRVPFEDASAMSVALKHISDPPPPPSSLNPRITPQIEGVILKALDKDPHRRYYKAEAFIKALEVAFANADEEDTEELENWPPFEVSPYETRPDALVNPTQDNIPTLNESSQDRPLLPFEDELSTQARLRRQQRNQMLRFVGLAVLLLVLIGAGAVLGLGLLGEDDPPPTPTALAAALVTNTEVAPLVAEATEDPTPTSTPTPTRTPTPTERPATATPTPTPTATPAITATPRINAQAAGEPQVLLRYDGRSLLIYNRSPGQQVNLTGLRFVSDGVTFPVEEFDDPNDRLRRLRATNCFQLFTIRYSELPDTAFPADICRFRQGFRSTVDSFWVTDEATFEVRRDGDVLATCPTVPEESEDEMRCLVDVRVEEENDDEL